MADLSFSSYKENVWSFNDRGRNLKVSEKGLSLTKRATAAFNIASVSVPAEDQKQYFKEFAGDEKNLFASMTQTGTTVQVLEENDNNAIVRIITPPKRSFLGLLARGDDQVTTVVIPIYKESGGGANKKKKKPAASWNLTAKRPGCPTAASARSTGARPASFGFAAWSPAGAARSARPTCVPRRSDLPYASSGSDEQVWSSLPIVTW